MKISILISITLLDPTPVTNQYWEIKVKLIFSSEKNPGAVHAYFNTYCIQKLTRHVNSLHGRLNCEIGGLDYQVITTEYKSRVHCIHL